RNVVGNVAGSVVGRCAAGGGGGARAAAAAAAAPSAPALWALTIVPIVSVSVSITVVANTTCRIAPPPKKNTCAMSAFHLQQQHRHRDLVLHAMCRRPEAQVPEEPVPGRAH